MEQAESLAATLKEKVEILTRAFEERGKALRQAGEKIELLSETLETERQKTASLVQEINELKTAMAWQPNPQERHAAKAKIGAMIREIDKCIALLNQ